MPKKIAYILTPIDFGGSDKANLNFLRNVNRNRFQVVPILLIRPWESENAFINELEGENYLIKRIPVADFPRSEGRDLFRVIKCYKSIKTYIKENSFDLIHTHGYFADIVGIPAGRYLNVPVISTCHGFISNNLKLKLYNYLDRLVLRFSGRIIAVSEEIKKGLIKSGISEPRIEVILNAVRTDIDQATILLNRTETRGRMTFNENDFIVGYIGRLSEEKGVNYLIDAISILFDSGISVKVLIIGAGPQKKDLEDLVDKKGISRLVTFVGFQSDIENWIPAIDLLALPSLTEGTPMALLEAMALGVPVVASAVGGVPSIVRSGENGILVSPGRPQELAEGIKNLYRNLPLRRDLSGLAQKTIKNKFNIDDWTRRIENIYDSLIVSHLK